MLNRASFAVVALCATAASGQIYYHSLEGPPPTSGPGSSSDGSFFGYFDIQTGAWTRLNDYESEVQMAVDQNNTIYGMNYAGVIESYDPLTDSWASIGLGAVPNYMDIYGNLEVTPSGEFIYHNRASGELAYTVGGVWQTANLGPDLSVNGAYDAATNKYYFNYYNDGNLYAYDFNTNLASGLPTGMGAGDTRRSFVLMDGLIYYDDFDINPTYAIDPTNGNATLIGDQGDYGTQMRWLAGTGDHQNGIVYFADLTGRDIWSYDTLTGAWTDLGDGPLTAGVAGSQNHSSILFVPIPAPGGAGVLGVGALLATRRRR